MIDNAQVIKMIKKTLDPILKSDGFDTVRGRYWYKYDGDFIFLLGTEAMTPWFSYVTKYPTHSFSVWYGIWIDYIDRPHYDYFKKLYGKPLCPTGKNGELFPKYYDCKTTSSFLTKPALNRTISQKDILRSFPKISVIEKARRDIWLCGNDDQIEVMLENLKDVVHAEFLCQYPKYKSVDYLRALVEEHSGNVGKNGGPIPNNIEYSTLFYRRWGPCDKYIKYLTMYEQHISDFSDMSFTPKDKKTVPPYFYTYQGP